MKETVFYIILNLKTTTGYEPVGKFFVGNHSEHAQRLFDKLQGTTAVNEQTMLTLELMETREGLPYNLNILGCTLPQLGENCKMITRETFALMNLKPL